MSESLSYPCGPIISSIQPFDPLSYDIFSQGQDSKRSVWCRKRQGHFFWNEQICKERTYKLL